MSRTPDREETKGKLLFRIEKDIMAHSRAFLNHPMGVVTNMSNLVECLIFWVKDDYAVSSEEGILQELAKTKIEYCLTSSSQRISSNGYLHVTLDNEGISFIKKMRSKYKHAFSSQSEMVEIILVYANKFAEDEATMRYFMQRLVQVKENHPTRRLRA